MKRLKELLTKKKNTKVEIDEKTILFVANKIIQAEFGEAGRENIFPDKILDKLLFFRTSGSLWSSELWLRKEKIKNEINKEFGGDVVSKIKI